MADDRTTAPADKNGNASCSAFHDTDDDATLSGQQGGAVPAGDLRPGLEEALRIIEAGNWPTPPGFGETANKMAAEDAYDVGTGDAAMKIQWQIEDALKRARLAEQPAPAETGADGVEGLRKGLKEALMIADQARCEMTERGGAWGEGMRDMAVRITARIHRRIVALDAGSSEEGR